MPVITGIGHERDETIADLVAHTSLKTPTAVAEFLIERVTSFDNYINELKQNLFTIASDHINSLKIKHDRISRSVASLIKIHMNTKKQSLESLSLLVRQAFKSTLQSNMLTLNTVNTRMAGSFKRFVVKSSEYLTVSQKQLLYLTKNSIKEEFNKLFQFETSAKLLDPALVLKRGYTMTYHNGKLIKNLSLVKAGDIIETDWQDGTASSTVNYIKNNEKI